MDVGAREQVLAEAEEKGVRFVRLQFTDIFGVLKNIAITANQLEKALDGQIMFDGSASSAFYRLEESDMYLIPDPRTFVTFPWRPQEGAVGRLICDIHDANGEPFAGCGRSVLKRIRRETGEKGFSVVVAPETEFFLFVLDENGKPTTTTHDSGGLFDLTPLDLGENARRDMIMTLQDMGFDMETSHHELSPGQHEIDFSQGDALDAADAIVTFKFVIRTIAQRHGLHATFMPKPLRELGGSGMHIRMRLFREGQNVFDGEGEELLYFTAGILEHAAALTALANPTVNSYKRFANGGNAPKCIGWSKRNRNTLLRVPSGKHDAFIEWRSPDPSCNPYLTLAGAIEAGIEGINKKIEPPQPVDSPNTPGLSLPQDLKQALEALEADALVKKVLGEYIATSFAKAKEKEWNDYLKEVHPWEQGHYLTKF